MTSSPKLRQPAPARWATARTDAETYGGHLAQVAEALGWDLFQWQRQVADVALEHVGGQYRYRTVGASVGRQNGKTALAASRIAYELLKPGHVVAFTAQNRGMARYLWEAHTELIIGSSLGKRVKRIIRANGQEALIMHNGAQYRVVTPNRKGSRGLTCDLVVIDEALHIGMDVVAALQPTMATRPNAQFWILSNAGDSDSVMLAHYRNLGHEQRDGDDGRLCWMEWAPTEDKIDPLDREVWYQAIPTLSEEQGVTVQAVAEAAETTAADMFAREWLNVWPAAEAIAVIEMADWLNLERTDILLGEHVVLGVDISPNRDSAAIAVSGLSGAFTPVEIIDHRYHVGWVEGRLIELCKKWRAGVVIDGGSPAGTLIPVVEQAGINVTALGMRDYARACGSFYDGVQEKTVAHLGDRLLNDAVGAATKRRLSDQWAWNRRSTVDITPLVAATLARWGCVSGTQKTARPAVF